MLIVVAFALPRERTRNALRKSNAYLHASRKSDSLTNRRTLQDQSFRTIGYIETRNDGTEVLLDSSFRTCGYYDPSRDLTTDASFRTVGHGNLLVSLLPASSANQQAMSQQQQQQQQSGGWSGCAVWVVIAIVVVGAVFVFSPGMLAIAILRSSLLADWDTAQMWTFGIATSIGVWLLLFAITRAWRTASLVYFSLCLVVLAGFLFAMFGFKSAFAQQSSIWYFPGLTAADRPAPSARAPTPASTEPPTAVAADAATAVTIQPTPVAKETFYTTIGVAHGDTLKVRTGPGANYPIIERLSSGFSGLRIVGGPVTNDTTEWVKIAFAGRTGWVARRYLTPQPSPQ